MSLVNKIKLIPELGGIIRVTGKLQQYGHGACILNASINGEQKTTINYKGEEVPKISTECLTNGVFKHRITNLPSAVFDAKKDKVSLDALKELFDVIQFNRVEFRSGSVMSSSPVNSEKALRVDEAVPYDNNKEYFSVENRRLGIKGDSGDNDYPRQQILFKNLKMFFSAYLDLNSYHPTSNKIILKFLEKVDGLVKSKENDEFKAMVTLWLDKVYPVTKEGNLDIDEILSVLLKELSNYEHPVHKRYNSFLLLTNLKTEKLNSMEEYIQSLDTTKHHHGL